MDVAFSSAPIQNSSAPPQGSELGQDMFDKAFGAPDSSPFGVPPVAMVQSFICDHLLLYHPNPNDPFDNKDIVILEFLFFVFSLNFFFFF